MQHSHRSFLLCLLLYILSALLLFSCARQASAGEILTAALAAESTLPPLYICESGAAESSGKYADPALLAAMFGEDGEFPEEALLTEYAFYVSKSPSRICEFAVFIVSDPLHSMAVERACRRRADAMKNAANEGLLPEYAANAEVIVRGRYIIYSLSENSESTADAAVCLIS